VLPSEYRHNRTLMTFIRTTGVKLGRTLPGYLAHD
jgi:hypothetical protein